MKNRNIIHKKQTVSTNEDAKALIKATDSPLYTVIAAECQTGGRGRLGRNFFSPAGGLYFSVIYPLPARQSHLSFLTLSAGYAVATALDALCGTQTQIKWPNDIYIGDKKVCGILTEAVSCNSRITAVVGIGINLFPPTDVPADLQSKIGFLANAGCRLPDKQTLMLQIIENLDRAVYKDNCLTRPPEPMLAVINQKSYLKGKKVNFTDNNTPLTGTADKITPDGSMKILLPDKRSVDVKFGEVVLG